MDHHFTNWRWYWHPKKLNPASFSWFLMIIRLIHLKDVCNMDKAAMVTPSLQRGQGFRKFHGRSISDGSLGNAESLGYEKETHKNIWFPDSKLLRSLKLFTVCPKLFDGFELKMMRLETELKNVGWNIVWYTNRQHVHSKLYVTWTHRALLQQTQFCFPIQTFRIIPGLLQLYTFNLEFRAALLGLRQGGVLKAIKHGNWCEFFHVRSMYLYQLVSKHILYRVRQLQNVNSEQDAIDSRLSDRFSNHLLDGTFQLFGHHWFIIHIPIFIYRFSRCNLQLLAADTNSKLFNIFNNHSRVSPSGCPTVLLLSPAVRALGTHPDRLEALDFKHWLVLIMCWLVDCKPKNLELSISAHHRWRMDNSKWNYMYNTRTGFFRSTTWDWKRPTWDTRKHQHDSNNQIPGMKQRSGIKTLQNTTWNNPCRYLTPNALCSEVLGSKVMERYGKSFPIVSQWHPWFPTVDPGEITAP